VPGRSPDSRDGRGGQEKRDDREPAVGDLPTLTPSDSSAGEGGRRPKGPRQVRAGDTLGRYELGDELGEGGMATVFRARDRELRRDVAVKVLFPHLARRSEIVRRFHREARAAAGLEHPNILRIYDVGDAGGAQGDDPPYIVMELIRGRTLLQEIEQRGAMLAEIVACIGALLGDALAAAHAAGVIHRDVKPANVLIAPGGRLLLADFGVARLETEDSLVTRTGALLGTPAYMSPEQASGDLATAQSDIYSLGATLYQLATGTLPYSGSPAKVMTLIAAGSLVPPVRRRPACGPDLSRLIERVMAAEPSVRPASAATIAAELRAQMAAGGLGDAPVELAAYFEDPDGFLRTRIPTVVTSLVAAAKAAVAEAKLPRAMALVDRASALAPEDPTVAALVQTVTEGGHASRRRRRLAIAGIAVGLAGGATALGWRFASSTPAAPPLAVSGPGDAAITLGGPGGSDASATSATPVAPANPASPANGSGMPDAATAPVIAPLDVSATPARDVQASPSAPNVRPAVPLTSDAVVPHAPDATVRVSLDAAPPSDASPPHEPPEPDAAAAPAAGYIVVRNDLWCNVWIDRNNHGNQRNEPIEVTPGHHVVRCVNPAGEWTQETDVAPGATQALTGTMLRELAVTLEVDATIDGKRYARGAVVLLKPGNVEVIVGGTKKFITFRGNCTLRDQPELGCYL
jgi:eukaryotic-like serine/threonine-protein kinase